MIVGSIALAAAIFLAFLRVPLAFALLAVSVAGISFAINWIIALQLLPLTISDTVLSYDLAIVPMFILMGNVISKTWIAHDLLRAAYAFVGNVRGGLALSTMVACSGFSAVCGSSYATAATMARLTCSSIAPGSSSWAMVPSRGLQANPCRVTNGRPESMAFRAVANRCPAGDCEAIAREGAQGTSCHGYGHFGHPGGGIHPRQRW